MAKSKPDKINIPYNYQGRFLTRYLYVEPKLLGTAHKFDYEGNSIKIELPGIQELSKEDKGSRRITCESWQRTENGKNIPVEYIIHNVDLRIFGDKKNSCQLKF